MDIHADEKYEVREKLWDRLEKCSLRLEGLEDMLPKEGIAESCYTKAVKKIETAYKLLEAFRRSPEDAEVEKQAARAMESLEQYLDMGLLDELTSIIQKESLAKKEFEEKMEEEDKRREDESGDDWLHILHLSDLHFGVYLETGNDVQNQKEFDDVVRRDLFSFLKDRQKEFPIKIVAVTGDISYCKREQGYKDFKVWLEKLCSGDVLGIDIKDHVVMCPGNHDKDCDGKSRHKDGLTVGEADEGKAAGLLTIDKIGAWQGHFHFFNDICAALNMESLTNFNNREFTCAVPYAMGIKKIEGIYFVVLNSAWNSFPRDEKNGSDHGQLFLGQRPLRWMLEEAGIGEDDMTVMLFHHPLAWLHEAEKRTYGRDEPEPSEALVRKYADVILNGHVHGCIKPPDILANRTVVFGGGTLYPDDSYLHQFEIISVNRTRHYCRQTVVCYDKQGEDGPGWKIEGGEYQPRVYYGIYRDLRDLITKYSLGEITMDEAVKEALDRSAEVSEKMFRELLEKTRDCRKSEITRKYYEQQETKSDAREESADKTKGLKKDSGEGEK